jgi:O-acetyl-ADP-ribose deacetylase (regulator of RNase III)
MRIQEFERTIVLKNAIQNTLEIANMLEMKSVAFPAIATGAYRFPTYVCA